MKEHPIKLAARLYKEGYRIGDVGFVVHETHAKKFILVKPSGTTTTINYQTYALLRTMTNNDGKSNKTSC